MTGLLDCCRKYWLPAALTLVLLTVSAHFLIKPLYDTDFFWHLKTGEWIWQHRMLPDHDPFNFTTPSPATPLITFTLTSYWLSQTMLYLGWLAGGMGGVVALRFIAAGLMLYTAWRRLRSDCAIDLSLLLFFSVMIFSLYRLERPQTVSFVCYGLLLLVLDRLRSSAPGHEPPENHSPLLLKTAMISAIMLFWSNSHGGYLVGQATILLVVTLEGVKYLHPRLVPLPAGRYRGLLIAGISGILCSLANPNGHRSLQFMLQTRTDNTSTQVQEFTSMMGFYSEQHPTALLVYFALMFLIVLLIVSSPVKADLTDATLLLFLGGAACQHIRYAAFFAIAAIPVAGRLVSGLPAARLWARRLLPLCAITISLITVSKEAAFNIATARAGTWVSNEQFPVEAADFIIANRLQGNMYNDYNWGGYLIWRLAPERRVFADGRNLSTDTLALTYRIVYVQTSASGEKIWKQLLQQYGVNFVVTTSHTPEGDVTPLTEALLADADWRPVFAHRMSRSIIFVRNVPENDHILAQSNLGRR